MVFPKFPKVLLFLLGVFFVFLQLTIMLVVLVSQLPIPRPLARLCRIRSLTLK